MTPIEKIDSELTELAAEAARIESLPPPVSERYAAIEVSLRAAEELYRTSGLQPLGHPDEQRMALVGMCMVVGADKILKVEHQRAASAGTGMAADVKASRLEHLRTAVLAAACRRELALREVERDGEFLPRGVHHPELLVIRAADLERIAAR